MWECNEESATEACVDDDGACPEPCHAAIDNDCVPDTSCVDGIALSVVRIPGTEMPVHQVNGDTTPLDDGSVQGLRRIIGKPLPGGGAAIAWTAGGGDRVYITRVDAAGQRIAPDITVNGIAVGGLVVDDDGYALLVGRNPDRYDIPQDLWLVKLKASGERVFESLTVGASLQDFAYSETLGDTRLVWTGEEYRSFHALDDWDHQADRLLHYDRRGHVTEISTQCGHSLGGAVAHNANLNHTGYACLADGSASGPIRFEGGDASSTSIPVGPSGSGASMGALAAAPDGYVLAYGRDRIEGSTVRDIATVRFRWNGSEWERTEPVFITNTPGVSEAQVQLARFGDGFLIGWVDSYTAQQVTLAHLDDDGQLVGAPQTRAFPPFRREDFFNFENGDVGWVGSWGWPRQLYLVRVSACCPPSDPECTVCDPPWTCPSGCDDHDACTSDTLSNAGTAAATCTFAPVSDCISGDGCCPAGCDSVSDLDCGPVCGDHVVEEPETCDPTSNCLLHCGGLESFCLSKGVLGMTSTCDLQCMFFPTTSCSDDDGCCPAGCNADTDTDCIAASGNTSWLSFFVGAGREAHAEPSLGGRMAVDHSVNCDGMGGTDCVVVVGSFREMIDLGGGILAADQSGATSSTQPNDIFLAKFTSSGDHVWSQRLGGPGDDVGSDVAIQPDGNVVIAGRFAGSVDLGGGPLVAGASHDSFVAGFSSAGTHGWSTAFSGDDLNSPSSLAVDPVTGAIVVAGWFYDAVTIGDSTLEKDWGSAIYIAELDPSGSPSTAWSLDVDGEARIHDLAIDTAGNLLMAGGLAGSLVVGGTTLSSHQLAVYACPYTWDGWLAKYAPDRSGLWGRVFGSAGRDEALGIAVSSGGSVAVTGFYGLGSKESEADFGDGVLLPCVISVDDGAEGFLARFAADGFTEVARRFGGTGREQGNAVTFDSAGNMIVTGRMDLDLEVVEGELHSFAGKGVEAIVIKYTEQAVPLWFRRFGSENFTIKEASQRVRLPIEEGRSVAVDLDDNVIVYGKLVSVLGPGFLVSLLP